MTSNILVKLEDNAKKDLKYWKKNSPQTLKRIKRIIDDIIAHPFEGIGHPESLKYDLSGLWSRRITAEHRLVYAVIDNQIVIYQCRYHY